jgi:hypothetical protein
LRSVFGVCFGIQVIILRGKITKKGRELISFIVVVF